MRTLTEQDQCKHGGRNPESCSVDISCSELLGDGAGLPEEERGRPVHGRALPDVAERKEYREAEEDDSGGDEVEDERNDAEGCGRRDAEGGSEWSRQDDKFSLAHRTGGYDERLKRDGRQ